MRTGRPPKTEDERLADVLARIQRGAGCWGWSGYHRSSDGRPYFRREPAYRVVWQVLVGPLDPEAVLHHVCENQACVRPDPLHVVSKASQSEHNQAHGRGGDWGQSEKTHCPAGHEYTPENTYTFERERDGVKSIERHCKTCRRAAKARYRAKKYFRA